MGHDTGQPQQHRQQLILWCTVAQGAVATGVWVIAHECGHQAFSQWQSVNDGVGLVLHSLLLVPYYSWCALLETCAKGRPEQLQPA